MLRAGTSMLINIHCVSPWISRAIYQTFLLVKSRATQWTSLMINIRELEIAAQKVRTKVLGRVRMRGRETIGKLCNHAKEPSFLFQRFFDSPGSPFHPWLRRRLKSELQKEEKEQVSSEKAREPDNLLTRTNMLIECCRIRLRDIYCRQQSAGEIKCALTIYAFYIWDFILQNIYQRWCDHIVSVVLPFLTHTLFLCYL